MLRRCVRVASRGAVIMLTGYMTGRYLSTADIPGRGYLPPLPSLLFISLAENRPLSSPKDPRGLPTSCIPPDSSIDLQLVGVGMRRKNLYLVKVDVYIGGLYLAPRIIEAVVSTGGSDASHVLQAISNTNSPKTSNSQTADIKAALVLKFVRSVTSKQVVTAIVDAFTEINQEEVGQFKAALERSVGDGGLAWGEELMFCWRDGGGLDICRNGVLKERIVVPRVESRLLQVYVEPGKSAIPEMVASIKETLAGGTSHTTTQ